MIYSGGNELLCKLFDEVGITPLESILVIGYSLKLKSDFSAIKINLKSNLRFIHGMMSVK